MLVSLLRTAQAHRRRPCEEPHRRLEDDGTGDQIEGQRREERHRPVEQDLSTDDDVIRHEREEQRGDHPGAAAVEGRPGQVRDHDRTRAEQVREEAGEEVAGPEAVPDREQRLEEQRVRAEDREERRQVRGVRDRRRLARVDGLVAVEAEPVDLPEPEKDGGRDSGDHERGLDHERGVEAARRGALPDDAGRRLGDRNCGAGTGGPRPRHSAVTAMGVSRIGPLVCCGRSDGSPRPATAATRCHQFIVSLLSTSAGTRASARSRI